MTPSHSDQPHDPTAPKCTATAKRSGRRCTHWPMKGATVCAQHGGKAPQVMAAAERRVAKAEAARLVGRLLADPNAPLVDNPVLELMRVAGRMGHAVDVLGERVNEIDAAGQLDYSDANQVNRVHVLGEMWLQLMDKYQQTLTNMTRLEIEKRVVRLQEEQGALLAGAIQQILERLELSPAQQALVPTVVPGVLMAIGSGS